MASSERVAFREALEILRRIPPKDLLSPFDPREYEDSLGLARAINDKSLREGRGIRAYCPTCGWPAGRPGFVRLPFPIGHELFGRAWPCPKCNGGRR